MGERGLLPSPGRWTRLKRAGQRGGGGSPCAVGRSWCGDPGRTRGKPARIPCPSTKLEAHYLMMGAGHVAGDCRLGSDLPCSGERGGLTGYPRMHRLRPVVGTLQNRIRREMGTQALNQQPETGPGSPHSDGRLLEHFVKDHDERAFAELVTRHGPYILGVCRRVTAHPQDAEDVFQACFLELVRKAASILQHDSVAGWLQTVAVRLASRARAQRVRQPQREAASATSEAVADAANVSWREVRQVLEEEMARLPDDLRSAVVVCLFEGRTQEEAGRILNVNPRTLKDRVRRGRELLRGRLSRRGITLAVMGTLLSGGEVEASVPAALQTATLKAAAAVVHKTALAGAGTVSPSALTLACSTWLSAGGVVIAAAALVVSSIGGYVAWGRRGHAAHAERQGVVSRREVQPHAPQMVRPRAGEIHPARTGRAADHAPVARRPGTAAGGRPRPAVRGDFELEATFELLHIDRPDEGRARGSPFISSWTMRNGTACGSAR